MGVTSSIPYDIHTDSNLYPDRHRWELYDGKKNGSAGDESLVNEISDVSIFSFKKRTNPEDLAQLALAQKGCQRLKSLIHPYILGFIESTEVGESFLMVTERATPIGAWLRTIRQETDSGDLEMLWGLKCILEALHFLHSKCHIAHCNVSTLSCFYTRNGDWKLGVLDLACNISSEGAFFEENLLLQDRDFTAPELIDGSWKDIHVPENVSHTTTSTGKKCGWSIDVFAVGKLLQTIYPADSASAMPKCLENPLKRMLSSDHRRRPTCASILKAPCFHTEELKLMTTICELQLKPPLECIEIFELLKEKVEIISKAVCTFKVLTSIGSVLGRAINDFQARDNRETCRRIVHSSLELLARFSDHHKVDEGVFNISCLSPYQQLWTFTDRAIRTALLRTLKPILYLLSRDVVNRKLFEPLLAGFSDSNSKLREDTLKNLVYVVEKLDESQLQDKLVRCICNLQNDSEASVRTNAVIFLSRITGKLTVAVRQRVLAGSYCKAMKDPFIHCRIAGLKATEASTPYYDTNQICTRLIPQISLLLLDKSRDVNELAMSALEACTERVRQIYEERKSSDSVSVSSKAPLTVSDNSISNGDGDADGSANSDWTKWALNGLTKSMEKVTNEDTVKVVEPRNELLSQSNMKKVELVPENPPEESGHFSQESVTCSGWGVDEDDLDLEDIVDEPLTAACEQATKSVSVVESSKVVKPEHRAKKPQSRKPRNEGSDKKMAPTVKKLSLQSDERESWDDF